jgi:hypothetical protein
VPFNEVNLEVLDAIEKKYAPDKQVKTTIENPTPSITTSIKSDSARLADSMKRLDSQKKIENTKLKK